jgi:hypothetical protein
VAPFRKRLEKVVADKHEETMARMGAIMATGALVPFSSQDLRAQQISAQTCMHACLHAAQAKLWCELGLMQASTMDGSGALHAA